MQSLLNYFIYYLFVPIKTLVFMCNNWGTDPDGQGIWIIYSKIWAGFMHFFKAQFPLHGNSLHMTYLSHVATSAICILNVLLWGDHTLFTRLSASSRLLSCRALVCGTSSPQGQVESRLPVLPHAPLCCHVLLQVRPTARSSIVSYLFPRLWEERVPTTVRAESYVQLFNKLKAFVH